MSNQRQRPADARGAGLPAHDALDLIAVGVRPLFRERVRDQNWLGALNLANSERRIGLGIALLPVIPTAERASVLAEAISGGDRPWAYRAALCAALRSLDQKVFDDGGRAVFDRLPAELHLYRGTVEAEGATYGVCWTLRRETAKWFATQHGRCRNTHSPPVILETVIAKADVAGCL